MKGSGSADGAKEHFLSNILIMLSAFWGGSHRSSLILDQQKGGRKCRQCVGEQKGRKEVGDDSRYFHDFV